MDPVLSIAAEHLRVLAAVYKMQFLAVVRRHFARGNSCRFTVYDNFPFRRLSHKKSKDK